MTVENDGDDISISDGETFSDPEGFEDDIDDEDIIPHLIQQKPIDESKIDRSIIIDGIPCVNAAQVGKLQDFIFKKFEPFGIIVKSKMALDKDGGGRGFMFLIFDDPASAKKAVITMHNLQMDSKHTFKVNFLSDYEKCINAKEEFAPPEKTPFVDLGYLKQWRLDKRCRDQYFLLNNTHAAIYWNSVMGPEKIEERNHWSERTLVWSPNGTYLSTFHNPGICLWAGPQFTRSQRLVHQNVFLVHFSPDEKHCVTYSQTQKPDPTTPQHFISSGILKIFDIKSGKIARTFECESLCNTPNAIQMASFEPPPQWPLLRWSSDGRYFARLQKDMISVYDSQDGYGLCDKKSIRFQGLQDFAWSPTDNWLAYWVAEEQNVPARVVILEMPSRREIIAKNLFSVANITLHWQPSGDYLCVKVQRYQKRKTTNKGNAVFVNLSCELEIFHLREKEIPVDKIDLKVQNVTILQWEPSGPRFAYIAQLANTPAAAAPGGAANTPSNQPQNTTTTMTELATATSKFQLGVQMVHTDRGKVEKIMDYDISKWRFNHLSWSPKGQFLVVANLGGAGGSGRVEWWDIHDNNLLNFVNDCSYTHIQWDSTGRYIATWTSKFTCRNDNEVVIYTSVGRQLYKLGGTEFQDLYTFSWRPRPPALLTEAEVKNIKKNMKKYSQKYDMDDKLALQTANKEFTEKRRKLRAQYREFRQKLFSVFTKLDSDAVEKPPQTHEDEGEVEVTVNIYEVSDNSKTTAV